MNLNLDFDGDELDAEESDDEGLPDLEDVQEEAKQSPVETFLEWQHRESSVPRGLFETIDLVTSKKVDPSFVTTQLPLGHQLLHAVARMCNHIHGKNVLALLQCVPSTIDDKALFGELARGFWQQGRACRWSCKDHSDQVLATAIIDTFQSSFESRAQAVEVFFEPMLASDFHAFPMNAFLPHLDWRKGETSRIRQILGSILLPANGTYSKLQPNDEFLVVHWARFLAKKATLMEVHQEQDHIIGFLHLCRSAALDKKDEKKGKVRATLLEYTFASLIVRCARTSLLRPLLRWGGLMEVFCLMVDGFSPKDASELCLHITAHAGWFCRGSAGALRQLFLPAFLEWAIWEQRNVKIAFNLICVLDQFVCSSPSSPKKMDRALIAGIVDDLNHVRAWSCVESLMGAGLQQRLTKCPSEAERRRTYGERLGIESPQTSLAPLARVLYSHAMDISRVKPL